MRGPIRQAYREGHHERALCAQRDDLGATQMQSHSREINAVRPTNLRVPCGKLSVIDSAGTRSFVVSIRFRRTRRTSAVWH